MSEVGSGGGKGCPETSIRAWGDSHVREVEKYLALVLQATVPFYLSSNKSLLIVRESDE